MDLTGSLLANPEDVSGALSPTAQSFLGAGPVTVLSGTAQSFLGAGTAVVRREGQEPEPAFTPNFPAYPSGHATFGSACFNTLRMFRAENPVQGRTSDDIGETLREFVSDELNGIALDPAKKEPRERVTWTEYPHLPDATQEEKKKHPLSSLDLLIRHNARSRVFLGVHWDFDADGGIDAGGKVARRTFELAYTRA